MHDVSEIECHARGPWMERGMKRRGEMTDEARSTKECGTQKKDEGGNRWIEGVRRKERQGWKGGIKWGGDKHTETDRKRLFRRPMPHILSAGIRAARWLLTQHTQTYTHTQTRTATCCQKDLLGACRDMSHSIHITTPQHIQTNILCCLSTAVTGILTFPWQKGEDLRVLPGCVEGVRGETAALHRSSWYSTGEQWVIAGLLQQR